ncbi:MAG: hypothetical protein NTW19_21285 [Planctomycetota bacterium]|nr:hypothetical protein [Planctomycetota bacterium]
MPHMTILLFALLALALFSAPSRAENASTQPTTQPTSLLTPADLTLFRHPEIKTARPFGFDIDDQGLLWQGNQGAFWVHDTKTGKAHSVAPPELAGLALSGCVCFQGKIVVVHQICDHATVYDPATKTARKLPLPGSKTNVWNACRADDKLLLFDRSDDGGILIVDDLDKPVRKIPAVKGRWPNGGRQLADGRVLFGSEPGRLFQFFDPKTETLGQEIPYPPGDISFSGGMLHDDILYLADAAAGRLIPYSLKENRWLDPIPTPDRGVIYGFIGGGFQRGSVGYFCLSTYNHPSRLDPATGKLIIPPHADIGVDGKPHHFLDRFLAFDARTRTFSYLQVPPQKDGYPLICYSLQRGNDTYITGYVIPFAPDGSLAKEAGDWIVWQSKR